MAAPDGYPGSSHGAKRIPTSDITAYAPPVKVEAPVLTKGGIQVDPDALQAFGAAECATGDDAEAKPAPRWSPNGRVPAPVHQTLGRHGERHRGLHPVRQGPYPQWLGDKPGMAGGSRRGWRIALKSRRSPRGVMLGHDRRTNAREVFDHRTSANPRSIWEPPPDLQRNPNIKRPQGVEAEALVGVLLRAPKITTGDNKQAGWPSR